MSEIFRRVFLCVTVAVLVAACSESNEPGKFIEGPKGYVEFYIPSDDPLAAEMHADAQVFLVRNGERVFKGMTLKWKKTAGARRGVVVAVPPGTHTFSVEVAGGGTPVSVNVEKDAYVPVRITSSGITRTQIIGMTNRVQFKIHATPEAPQRPGGAN